MLTRTELTNLKYLVDLLGKREIYLYGDGFRNRCLGDNTSILSVMVYANEQEYGNINNMIIEKNIDCFKISYCENIIHETVKNTLKIDTLYLDVHSLLENNDGTVESFEPKALTNLKEKELTFTKTGFKNIKDDPYLILESIILASQHDLTFGFETFKHIFVNKHLTKEIPIHKINIFLNNLFYKSNKRRKGIALTNTLGISNEIFGCNLVENSALNHLNKKDISEFFTIIFSNVPLGYLNDFLVKCVGFKTWDIKDIINETKSIEMVIEEDDKTALKILKMCGKKRLYNLIRLFKLLGYKTLAKKIKEQKNSIIAIPDLKITAGDIKTFFNVDESQAHKALEIALDYAIIQPHNNNKDDLLLMLNKQIESVRHA